MIITLVFCADVEWQISQQPSSFPELFLCHWQNTTHSFENTLLWYLRHSRSKSILRFQGIILHNPFAQSWCLHLLYNFLVACICALCHFLGVQLYSNFTIGHLNFERVLSLILPSRLIESVSSASILHCHLIPESASQGEGCCTIVRDQYLSWGSTVALNCFLTQKSVSRMTRGRSRKRHWSSMKSTDKNIIPKQDKVKRLLLLQLKTHKYQKRKTIRVYRNKSKKHRSW
jgi:hypothetical protein